MICDRATAGIPLQVIGVRIASVVATTAPASDRELTPIEEAFRSSGFRVSDRRSDLSPTLGAHFVGYWLWPEPGPPGIATLKLRIGWLQPECWETGDAYARAQ